MGIAVLQAWDVERVDIPSFWPQDFTRSNSDLMQRLVVVAIHNIIGDGCPGSDDGGGSGLRWSSRRGVPTLDDRDKEIKGHDGAVAGMSAGIAAVSVCRARSCWHNK